MPAAVLLAASMALGVPRTAHLPRGYVVCRGQWHILQGDGWVALRSGRLLAVDPPIEPPSRIFYPAIPLI